MKTGAIHRVEALLGIELGAIAGQVEQLNLILPLGYPRLHDLTVVHSQIVQNQEHFFPGILDQGS
jgi:hypothetical protein